jgi:hypothetical protein
MSKNIPVRGTKKAEDYAKKVRVEPPKQTRQEDRRTKRLPGKPGGQHDHGPVQRPGNKKYPEGGRG